MNDQTNHIDQLNAYINGELDAKQMLWIEKQLAEHEQWRTIYEGLLFAHEEKIHTAERMKDLAEQLNANEFKPKRVGMQTNWWMVAASIIGILLVSYVGLFLLNRGPIGSNYSAKLESNHSHIYPEDQIQIISSTPPDRMLQQSFNDQEVINIAKSYDSVTLNEDIEGAEPYLSRNELQSNSARRKTTETAKRLDGQKSANNYRSMLSRYGYQEVTPTVLNTFRGANGSNVPENHFQSFSQNAMSKDQLAAFKEKYESNYISRFPFDGIVRISFEVNAHGEAVNFNVLESPREEMTEVVVKLLKENAEWQPPQSADGKAISQTVIAKVSFGNTIYILLDFN